MLLGVDRSWEGLGIDPNVGRSDTCHDEVVGFYVSVTVPRSRRGGNNIFLTLNSLIDRKNKIIQLLRTQLEVTPKLGSTVLVRVAFRPLFQK